VPAKPGATHPGDYIFLKTGFFISLVTWFIVRSKIGS